MAGVGLVVTILVAANSDPVKMHETTVEGVTATAAGAGDEEIGHESVDQIMSEFKDINGSVASAGASTLLAGEKTELKM